MRFGEKAGLIGPYWHVAVPHLIAAAGTTPDFIKLRCCPWLADELAKAIHALQLREANSQA